MERVVTIQINFTGSANILDNQVRCEELLDKIVDSLGLTKLQSMHHKFQPHGFSSVYLLSESHIAIHTWPETNNGYITVSTCKVDLISEIKLRSIIEEYMLSTSDYHIVTGQSK